MADTVAPQEAQILYLEPDDEIPSVVRRVREADGSRVVLVAPGRTKATTSAIGLRLLAREATDAGRDLALVADAATRSLAAEAGIAAFASVSEAQSGTAADPGAVTVSPVRAKIHIVRGEGIAAPAVAGPVAGLAAPPASVGPPPAARHPRTDDTQAVPVVAPPRAAPRVRRPPRRRTPGEGRTALAVGVAGLVVLAGVVAAILPAATIRITPHVTDIGPLSYSVVLDGQRDSGILQSSKPGKATGTYDDSKPAKGVVTFANYNARKVQIPKGTPVSAGDLVFSTDQAVTVAGAHGIDSASTANVGVTANAAGPNGNVTTGAIDTIDDSNIRSELCDQFIFCTRRLVANRDALAGGVTKTGKQISQKDVDAVVASLEDDLDSQLSAHLAAGADRVYASPAQPQDPAISIPAGLVGTKDRVDFSLDGTLAYDRRFVTRDELAQAGRQAVAADNARRPAGTTVVDSSINVQPSDLVAVGSTVTATLTVHAAVTRDVDLEQLKGTIEGKSKAEAAQALSGVGAAKITFWPSWVDAVPRLGFRIDIALDDVSPAGSAPASGSGG